MGNTFYIDKIITACDNFLNDLVADSQYTKALRQHVVNLRNYARAMASDGPGTSMRLTLDEIGPIAEYYWKLAKN